MTKEVFNRIHEGLQEALAWSRGEIALRVTDFSTSPPITSVRYRGAPAKIGEGNAPQTQPAKKHPRGLPDVQTS